MRQLCIFREQPRRRRTWPRSKYLCETQRRLERLERTWCERATLRCCPRDDCRPRASFQLLRQHTLLHRWAEDVALRWPGPCVVAEHEDLPLAWCHAPLSGRAPLGTV
eukprot:7379557-Prymnesium_polylepis.1